MSSCDQVVVVTLPAGGLLVVVQKKERKKVLLLLTVGSVDCGTCGVLHSLHAIHTTKLVRQQQRDDFFQSSWCHTTATNTFIHSFVTV